jgi:hypothetical protein
MIRLHEEALREEYEQTISSLRRELQTKQRRLDEELVRSQQQHQEYLLETEEATLHINDMSRRLEKLTDMNETLRTSIIEYEEYIHGNSDYLPVDTISLGGTVGRLQIKEDDDIHDETVEPSDDEEDDDDNLEDRDNGYIKQDSFTKAYGYRDASSPTTPLRSTSSKRSSSTSSSPADIHSHISTGSPRARKTYYHVFKANEVIELPSLEDSKSHLANIMTENDCENTSSNNHLEYADYYDKQWKKV